MRKTVMAVFCMTAGLAWAQDEGETETEKVSEVDLRVSVIENIDVTAEKTSAPGAEEADPEIDAILEEAQALEDDSESE